MNHSDYFSKPNRKFNALPCATAIILMESFRLFFETESKVQRLASCVDSWKLILKKVTSTSYAFYGHKCFAYVQGEQDITLYFVPVPSIVRSVMMVPDPWSTSRELGVSRRLTGLPDSKSSRFRRRFFEVTRYKYASQPSQIC